MKFKLIYLYSALVILITIVLFLTTRDQKKAPVKVENEIENKEMPRDEVHKGLNNLNAIPPNKQNVTSSVIEQQKQLRKEVENNPNDTLKLREYADFLIAAHKAEEAILYYEKILKIDSRNKEVLFTLSFIYNDKHDFKKAENLTNKILQIDPKDDQALYNLGAINASKGDKIKAREIWQRIIREYPNSSSANLAKSGLAKL